MTKFPSRYLRTVVIALTCMSALAACEDEEKERAQRRKDREARTAAAIAKGPTVVQAYSFEGGRLSVIEVPTKSRYGSLEYVRCVVWRDEHANGSQLQCLPES